MRGSQGSLDLGVVGRDAGMRRAVEHANEKRSGWSTLAFVFFEKFATANRRFTTEEYIAYALSSGLPLPPDKRAFGPIVKRALHANMIVFHAVGPSKSPSRHKGHATVWWSRLYKRSK